VSQRDVELRLQGVLAMADIAPLALGCRVVFVEEQTASFALVRPGEAHVGPTALTSDGRLRLAVRHALELCFALELCADDEALAGLVAARSAALFATLEDGARDLAPDAALVSSTPPQATALATLWSKLRQHQPSAAREPGPETARRLASLWPLLGPAEYLMGIGGDVRISLDADTGLNAYGCSPRPRPWAVTFASSTASSISERGYAGAETARRRLLRAAALRGADGSLREEANAIRRALVDFYAVPPETEVVLTPSGTDGELCALAIALLADPAKPLSNVLVAPEESGTGVPLAATGRHFANTTARGVAVTKGARIPGFPEHTRLVSVAIRTDDGVLRQMADVDAECRDKVAAEVAEGRRVLLHVMDQTKTGLLAPTVAETAEGVDVVVDACQARVSVASVQAYLARGFMVLVTGSKFFTGPPFAGALLLPPRVASRLATRLATFSFPTGLADYFGRFEWPDTPASAAFAGSANAGLMLRWAAALAEMKAFGETPESAIKEVLSRFANRVSAAIEANPDLDLHPVPPLRRPAAAESWDVLPTIFTFSVRAPGASPPRWLGVDEARQIYGWLNSDLSRCLPESATEAERALAARRFHIGQPVALATPSQKVTGALRICAGARLVSGEPSQAVLDPAARLEREIGDALAGLEKISLILRHSSAIQAVNPRPTFQG
jgi:selenocysteine lyase/cysteine desulfurase